MASFVGVAFIDGAGGGGMVGEVVLEPAVEAIGSSPGHTGRGERGGGRLDDQANFLCREQQPVAALVFAAQPIEHIAIEQAPKIKTFVGIVTAVETWSAASIAVFARATTEKM